MGLDPTLAAAVTLRSQRGVHGACSAADTTFQLSLAHVLLDGAYDGVVTLSDVMGNGDHGLGTLDRLDGELVVVDGVPWHVPHTGVAARASLDSRTPFVVLTTMEQPTTIRLRDAGRDQVMAAIDEVIDGPDAVVAVRLDGRFRRVLVRSVPPQSPPYRPYTEVCATDEVRWEHHGFEGTFVGFRFPDLEIGYSAGTLHLHGVDTGRTTGGHNHEFEIDDAQLSISVSRDVLLALPDRSMVDLLEMPADSRAVQRVLLRRGALTGAQLAAALGCDVAEAERRLVVLADRGFVEVLEGGVAGLGGEPRWRITMSARGRRMSPQLQDLLGDL
ncbi:MAG: acetolactate decarboxylase [Ilumatobacteraceae bacterium]